MFYLPPQWPILSQVSHFFKKKKNLLIREKQKERIYLLIHFTNVWESCMQSIALMGMAGIQSLRPGTPRVSISNKLESGARAGSETQVCQCWMRTTQLAFFNH